MIKWARENGCAWSQRTTRRAAKHGQLAALKYCVENGCPIDVPACIEVATGETREWLETLLPAAHQ